MELQISCRTCGAEFDTDLADMSENPSIECPECGNEADPTHVSDIVSAAEDFLASAINLRGFHIRIDFDSSEINEADPASRQVIFNEDDDLFEADDEEAYDDYDDDYDDY